MTRYWPARRLIGSLVRCEFYAECHTVLKTQADTNRCRAHRNYAGRCCGDKACQYGSRRVF